MMEVKVVLLGTGTPNACPNASGADINSAAKAVISFSICV